MTTPDSAKTVVFVCEHGAAKSVVAMAYFEQLVSERKLPFTAISRGTNPDSAVPPLVLNGLAADGLRLGGFTPRKFSLADLASAITVISFDQPEVAVLVGSRLPSSAWDGLPAVSENYAIARDSIRRRVQVLVDSLAKAHAQRGTA